MATGTTWPSSREDLQELPARGLAQTWRRALGLHLSGGDPVDADTFDLVAAALRLANVEGDHEPADIALVYGGEDVDEPVLDSEQTYRAMWLATVLPYSDELQDDLSSMFASRFAGELANPTVEDVCARAMAIALMGFAGHADVDLTADEDEPAGVDQLVDPDEDEGEEQPQAGGFEGVAEALTFLTAHQDDLLKRKSLNQLGRPMRRIFRLADTIAWLNGVERRDLLPVAHTIDRIWLAQRCADALLALLGPPPDDISPDVVEDGVDALTLLVSAGLYPYFVI